MPTVEFQVIGLEKLRETSKAFSRTLTAELKPAVKDTALEVRERARNKARAFSIGGFYPAGITHNVLPGGLTAEITSRAKNTLSIERGRQPGEMVRFGLILKWVQSRGIVRGISVATRKTVRLSKKGRQGAAADEYAVAREVIALIRSQGTRPLPHIIPAARESETGWNQRVLDAARDAMRTVKGA